MTLNEAHVSLVLVSDMNLRHDPNKLKLDYILVTYMFWIIVQKM